MYDSKDKDSALPRATLEIVGVPGEEVSIFPETPLDAPPAPIFVGEVPAGGCLRLRVPRSALLVVAEGYGSRAVRFEPGESFQQVDVRPARPIP
jgi:hypothetical protein